MIPVGLDLSVERPARPEVLAEHARGLDLDINGVGERAERVAERLLKGGPTGAGAEGGFSTVPLGHVAVDRQDDRAVAEVDEGCADGNIEQGAVVSAVDRFELSRPSAGLHPRDDGLAGGRVGRGALHRAPDQVAARPAIERTCRGVGVEDRFRLGVQHQDGVGRGLEEGLVRGLGAGPRAEFGPEGDLALDDGCKVEQDGHVVVRPRPGLAANRTEGAERVAIHAVDGGAEICDDAQIRDGDVVVNERVRAGIRDDERGVGCDDVLAEQVGERRLALRRERLRQALLALEELPVEVDEREEGGRDAEHPLRERGQAVELRLGWGIEQVRLAERGEPAAVGHAELHRLGVRRPDGAWGRAGEVTGTGERFRHRSGGAMSGHTIQTGLVSVHHVSA